MRSILVLGLLIAPLQGPRTPDRDTTAIATVPIIATLAMVVATLTLATTLRAATIHRSGVGSPTDEGMPAASGRTGNQRCAAFSVAKTCRVVGISDLLARVDVDQDG